MQGVSDSSSGYDSNDEANAMLSTRRDSPMPKMPSQQIGIYLN